MCELLGLNANVPTDICFSFRGFAQRGGRTGDHADGWGMAIYQGRGCQLFHDAAPSAQSPAAGLLQQWPIQSTCIIAHIRKATFGDAGLENCHPFRREWRGRYWSLAHNGHLERLPEGSSQRFRPVGSTDSEAAFCWLLDRLDQLDPDPDDALAIAESLHEGCVALAQHGSFNCLISQGDWLFSFATTNLWYLTRRAPFRRAHLVDLDLELDFAPVTTSGDVVTVIATQPLTDNEEWTRIQPGQGLLFRDGDCVADWHSPVPEHRFDLAALVAQRRQQFG